MTLPWDAVDGQVAIGFDGSFNWFVNGSWHTQAGTASGLGAALPYDAVDGQVAIGNDGSLHWFINDNWYTAPFQPSKEINPPQDVVAGQVAISNTDESFHWSPNGVQSYIPPPGPTLTTGPYRTRLSVGDIPSVSTPQTLNIQCRKKKTTDRGILRVSFYQATTLIESYDIILTNDFTLDSHDLTNYPLITDWSDIEVVIEGMSDPDEELTPEVSWIAFDMPGA